VAPNPERSQTASANDLAQQWETRGLAPNLLAEARALGVSDGQLTRMLTWNVTSERIEEEIAWAERLLHGTMRFRQLTPADDQAFRELWANAPEAIGDWDVTVERGPNAFAQFELQERPVLNGLFDGTAMVACVSFSIRRTVVAGRDIVVHYGQAMRVRRDYRGRQYAHWVRSLPWAIGLGRPTHLQYDYIRPGNMLMESWNRKFMPSVETVPVRDDEVPGVPVRVLQYPATRTTSVAPGSRPARVEDLARCVELLNRTHHGRDLYRPYTVASLLDRLDAGLADGMRSPWARPYSLGDYHVVERSGRIVACAGLWDRGRDLWERWRHSASGEEHSVAVTALLDYGVAEGHADALAALIESFIGSSHDLRRDYLVAPLEGLPEVAALLEARGPLVETRYLQWRATSPAVSTPTFLDLVYW